jgi:hypothetical protein
MKQHKGKDLRRVNLTIPDDIFRWLKIQAAKADMSISLYLTKMIEKEKKFVGLSEKS